MSGKKESKVNNKKITIGSVPVNQRSPSSKHSTKNTVTNATNRPLDGSAVNKVEPSNPLAASNKASPTKTSRNQVSANWNSVAGSLKSQRTISSTKKIGTIYHLHKPLPKRVQLIVFFAIVVRFSSKVKCDCVGL